MSIFDLTIVSGQSHHYRLGDGSTFAFDPNSQGSRHDAAAKAEEHYRAWEKSATQRAGRPLTPSERKTMRLAHAPGDGKRIDALQKQLQAIRDAAKPDPLLKNLADAENELRVERRRKMTPAERKVDDAREAIAARDQRSQAPQVDSAIEAAKEHAAKVLVTLRGDPLASAEDVLRAEIRSEVAAIDPAQYKALDAQWRAERAAAVRNARLAVELQAQTLAAAEQQETEAAFGVSRVVLPVQDNSAVPAAPDPEPEAPSSSYAVLHARTSLTLAKTDEDRQRASTVLQGLSDGTLTPAAYWAGQEQQ